MLANSLLAGVARQTAFRFAGPDGTESDQVPPGTCSYAELLTRSKDTEHLVGPPTVFVSHGKRLLAFCRGAS